jgi:hypothetical protein
VFETDMASAAIETALYLNAHRHWRNHTKRSALGPLNSVVFVTDALADGLWEVPYDRQRVLLMAVWTYWFYMALYTAFRPVLPGW